MKSSAKSYGTKVFRVVTPFQHKPHVDGMNIGYRGSKGFSIHFSINNLPGTDPDSAK
jgi:hypothetical protein